MIATREELCTYLYRILTNEIGNKDFLMKLIQTAVKNFNYPMDMSSDYFNLRTPFDQASNFELFILMDTINKVKEVGKTTKDFYSKEEIENYSKAKYKISNIKFPLKYTCIQVTSEQWIGCITAKELMELRNAELINYNQNSQRTMKRIVRGEQETWQIALNKRAVNQIMDLMQKGTFISNTITLNMPQDTEYVYDTEEKELIIKRIKHFDILDGYHRYIALSKAYNLDPDFDYPMEIRFASYPEGQDEYFTYQEDQKTKMSKLQSKALDPSDLANQICKRLNADLGFELSGQVLRSGGIIDMSIMSEAIRFTYLDNFIAQKDMVETRQTVSEELKKKLNYLINEDKELTKKSWTSLWIVCTIVCCKELEQPTNQIIHNMIKKIKEKDTRIIPSHLSRRMITNLKKCI